MSSFSLRALILVATAAILILRTICKISVNRSGRVPTAGGPLETPSASIVAERWRVKVYFVVVVAHGATKPATNPRSEGRDSP